MFEYSSMALSFALAFAIGFFTKRFWTLVFSLILSVVIGFYGTFLYINFDASVAKAGLGIIAIAPVLIIFFIGFNLAAALVGGLIGSFVGKKRASPRRIRQLAEKAG